jgi:hypothetical protein
MQRHAWPMSQTEIWELIQSLWLLGSRSPREEIQFNRRRVGLTLLIVLSMFFGAIAIAGLLLRLF